MVRPEMPKPLASVIIPNYNKERYVAAAIRSVLAQTISEIEVIVVDDGSTDDSARRIADVAAEDQRVRYHRRSGRLGAGAARNLGIRMAKGDLIALLDSDDLYSPDKLEKQLQCLGGSRETVVYCDWWRIDGNGNQLPPFKRGHLKKSGMVFGELLVDSLGINTNLLVPRACFDAVGPYDESLRYSEDHDMVLRLSRRFKFKYLDEKLYGYRVHPGNARNLLPREIVFAQKAIVTERHFRESGNALTKMQRRRISKHLLWYYAMSRQPAKLLRGSAANFESLKDLRRILLKTGLRPLIPFPRRVTQSRLSQASKWPS
jgi:glycosyltransferase involved in cell wall biosynthesis